jgi:hypothetical protein
VAIEKTVLLYLQPNGLRLGTPKNLDNDLTDRAHNLNITVQ